MDGQVLEYCARGIIRYLAGDVDKFRYFVNEAMAIYKTTLCTCGNVLIDCSYGKKKPARLCTSCGRIWRGGNVVRKCLVRREIA